MHKKFIVLSFIFLIQFILLSCFCNCDDTAYRRVYNAINIETLDTSGFEAKPVTDSVYFSTFGISVYFLYDIETLSRSEQNHELHGFGFSKAMACSCDEYVHPAVDPIISLTISVKDVETQEILTATDHFSIVGFYSGTDSIDEYIRENSDWLEHLNLELTSFDNIPNSAIFILEAKLESGNTFTKETQVINFR